MQWQDSGDMSGTIIASDKPISFTGSTGYLCLSSATSSGGGCDSAHQQIPPVSALGASIAVLVDTGSVGLRVFAADLAGTTVETTSETSSATFGNGNTLVGHTANAEVTLGNASAHVAFQLVEQLTCHASVPDCDLADGSADYFTSAGIHGILGIGLRPGMPQSIYSPLAQLGTDTFMIGMQAIELAPEASGFAPYALHDLGTLPNGAHAWADDAITACFLIDGVAPAPACTDAVFDTGSNAEVIYAPSLEPSKVRDGVLAPGVAFEVRVGEATSLAFAAGVTASRDLVFVDTQEAFSLIGVNAFLRSDVLYDLRAGTIAFRPR